MGSVGPSSNAICLFKAPRTTRSKTCCSLGVRRLTRRRLSASFSSWWQEGSVRRRQPELQLIVQVKCQERSRRTCRGLSAVRPYPRTPLLRRQGKACGGIFMSSPLASARLVFSPSESAPCRPRRQCRRLQGAEREERRDGARVWQLRTRKHARERLRDPSSNPLNDVWLALLWFLTRRSARRTRTKKMNLISADIERARRLLLKAYNLVQMQPCSSHDVRSIMVVSGLRSRIKLSQITGSTLPLWLDLSEAESGKPIDSVGFPTIDDGVPHLAALLRDLT
jgi:hypothetical protein